MNTDSHVLDQIFSFVCRFATFRMRFKLKAGLLRHKNTHRALPSKQRKSYTLCQKWISYNMKKKH